MQTLRECCLVEIVTHLEDYSLQELSLLPSGVRQDLLIHLPAADLYGFEGTPLVEGVNMEAVWYAKCQLDVQIYPEGNREDKMPARCVEHVTRTKWASGYLGRILLSDHHKKSWRDYYFDSMYGILFGGMNSIIPAEFVQSFFYAPWNYRYALYLVRYGKEDTDLSCCCSHKRIEFLYQGFFTPPRYQKYKPGEVRLEALTHLFHQFSRAGPRYLEMPMVKYQHDRWVVGPGQTLGLSNLHVLEYNVWMQCRLSKEDDFAKHLEIISSVQHNNPVLHTLKLLDYTAEPDHRFMQQQEKIEPASLTKAVSTSAYQNLQCLLIGGSVIEPYVEHLLPQIEIQPHLHSLEVIFGTWKERFALPMRAQQSISAFLKRPHFQLLGLGGFKLPAAFFCETVQEFLLKASPKKVTLYLSESEVVTSDRDLTIIAIPTVKVECDIPSTAKSLSIKYLATKCPTLGSEYILPAMRSTALNLEVLDVSDCGFADPQELLSNLAYHPNLHLGVLDISSNPFPQTEDFCKVLEDLLQNLSSVEEFHVRECGLYKPCFLASIAKTFSTYASKIKIRLLALARNGLSNSSKESLSPFFSSICCLPHLNNLGLSYNGLLPEHAELFRKAWSESGCTELSVLGWRLTPPPTSIQTWPPIEEPLDKQRNRAILRSTCWNLLL